MLDFFKNLIPSKKDRDVKVMRPIVHQINEAYATLSGLTDQELREKTAEFKERIRAHVKSIHDEIDDIKARAFTERDVDVKEDLFRELDKLRKSENDGLEEVLEALLPEAFAVIKETARRYSEHGEMRVVATDFDREVAANRDNVIIDGDTAIWKNEWQAAGNTIKWEMVHYDVQLIGGIVLHRGRIAEMATGEGKTLVATLPVYLNALTGKGVHIVTVNNYLAQRDAEWNSPIFQFHQLTVDCIDLHQPNSEDRRKAYLADITYGTNNEFGFDYLRDNMTSHPEFLVQREHHYTIIDEVDSVLVDEARTPLIISGPVPRGDKHEFYELKPRIEKVHKKQRDLVNHLLSEAKRKIRDGGENKDDNGGLELLRCYRGLPHHGALIRFLSEPGIKALLLKTEGVFLQDNAKRMPEVDEELYFTIDEKNNQVELTDKGREAIAQTGEDVNLFILPDVAEKFIELEKSGDSEDEIIRQKDTLAQEFAEKSERLHSINQLLKAYTLFERDIDYIVQEGKVMIVDEQTGRVLPGRRYSDGLHQAIEAKEDVTVEAATQTFATVTLQNYFRMYHKLAGMTGTAETEEAEFFEIYKLEVSVIPTNRPIVRDDREDLVYKTRKEKFDAVINEINAYREKGQPVLVGTTSVETSELISRMLNIRKIPHNVLNAKHHQREAEVVAEAGLSGTVTIATNMAGRGTDIKLGPGVVKAGGLAIIGTERHESRRIDRQLRGRAGRQGDPGSSQFFVSLEDDLMRLFGSDRVARIMDRIGLKDGEEIQHPMITKSISNAQKKVEENNFAMRKRLLEYDDVMNSQREVIYTRRRNALYGDRIKIDLDNMLFDMAQAIVNRYFDIPDAKGLRMECIRLLSVDPRVTEDNLSEWKAQKVTEKIYDEAKTFYKRKMDRLADTLKHGISNIKKNNPQVERIVIPFSDGNRKLQIIVGVKDALESEGFAAVDELEKVITLNVIDEKWKNHLREMDELRQSVQTAVFEQKDPLLVYKFESFELFQQALNDINSQVLSLLYKADLNVEEKAANREVQTKRDDFSNLNVRHDQAEELRKKQMAEERAIMSNTGGDPDQKLNRSQRRRSEKPKKKSLYRR
jgi:preprotein translocase subunit SecA